MTLRKKTFLAVLVTVLALASLLAACTPTGTTTTTTTSTTPTGGGGGGAVINSDGIISGEIEAIRTQATGYPYEMDVFVFTTDNVSSLPNPAWGKEGQVITAKTDEDVSSFHAGQSITAHLKYVGDVPLPGISLYIHDIKASPAAATIGLGEQILLNLGETAAIAGVPGLSFTFMDITADSRCPNDATCIWAGEVDALVLATSGGVPTKITLVQPGLTQAPATHDFQGYTLSFGVTPYPTAGVPINRSDYRLILSVTENNRPGVQFEPAPIDAVKVAVTVVGPKEVIVYIRGGLRDTCTAFASLDTQRSGSTVTITANVQHLTDQICGQVYTFFERAVDLGSDFNSGQMYTIKVNDTTTTFTMP